MDRAKIAAALAFAGLAAHAFFLPVSIAGMQIALAIAAAGVLLSPPRPLRTPLDLPAIAFVAVAIVSDLVAPSGGPGLDAGTLWRAVLGFFVVAHGLRLLPAGAPRRLALCAALGLLCASAVGLLQYWTGIDLVYRLGLRGVPAAVQAPGEADRFGAMGFFISRLTFGHNASVLVALLAGAAAASVFAPRVRLAVAAVCAVALVAVALTFDRAAWLGLGMAALVIALRRRRRALALGAAAAAALAAAHPAIRSRFVSAFSVAANADRLFIWSRALEIIRDHPLRGIGFANYPRVCGAYYDRVDPGFVMRTWAHNLELSTLAEMGPLGLLAIFWLLFSAARMLLRSASRFASGSLAALAAWFTMAQAHDLLYDTKVMYALWFALALGWDATPPAEAQGFAGARSGTGSLRGGGKNP